ncbi:ABC transporter permease [Porphyromonas levii]|uniref:ABC transporter permease n=1 Tax=Porphyromonas levii TaxID=28114 RepID=UPI001BA47063|nr:ABC transporter permease [Porphyromonas levii]
MIRQYLMQAWRKLLSHPILSAISIIATALAIAMMMILVMTDRVKTGNFAPEVNRDRLLFVFTVQTYNAERDSRSSSQMSPKLYKEVLSKMKTPESVGIGSGFFIPQNKIASTKPNSDSYTSIVKRTNLGFFTCYEYRFLYGHGFEKGDIESGLKTAIVSESMARKLFGHADVVGETVLMDYEPFEVIGVVSTPSNLFWMSYADMWIPYTSTLGSIEEEFFGDYSAMILAKDRKDIPKIQAEIKQLMAEYNDQLHIDEEVILNEDNNLMTWREMSSFLDTMGDTKKAAENRRNMIAFMLLFLIVPAINLSALTFSRHEQKLGELGIRRSYGAPRGSILSQVMTESLLYTLIGGLLGFLFSIVAVYAMRNLLFLDFIGSNFEMSWWQVFNAGSFFIALLLCIILNLLSSIIPAWLMSRKEIIDALNRR